MSFKAGIQKTVAGIQKTVVGIQKTGVGIQKTGVVFPGFLMVIRHQMHLSQAECFGLVLCLALYPVPVLVA